MGPPMYIWSVTAWNIAMQHMTVITLNMEQRG